jgi:RimJ/RimL family protein N-acetyltransferase
MKKVNQEITDIVIFEDILRQSKICRIGMIDNSMPYIKSRLKNPRDSYMWKIELKETNQFIGLAGLSLSNDKFKLGEIYYKLHPDYWGNGYATEIAKRLIKAGFEDFNLQKVEAGVATGNTKSIRVLEKVGMVREGLRRKILPIRGDWKDNYHYAIVKTDERNC